MQRRNRLTTVSPARATYADIHRQAPDELRPLIAALHGLILRMHPKATIIAWPNHRIVSYGVGPSKMTEHYTYIGVQSKHVNLGFYRGAALADPAGLLEGSGAKLRHVKVRSLSDARAKAVATLLREALKERREGVSA